MDNIQDTISKIMSDPEALSQVQSLGKMLGIGNSSSKETQQPPPPKEEPPIPTDMMGKISGLMPLFQQLRQEDDTTRLLNALRPFLSEEKRQKLDSAKKLLQFMKLIPLLRESGLMDFNIL
jgi:hypothetical protein